MRDITDLQARRDAEIATERPIITVRAGELAETIARAVALLRDAGVEIYDRGGMLVRPVHVVEPMSGSVRRPRGAVVLVAVDADWLRVQLATVAQWRRYTRGSDGDPQERSIDPPVDIARTIARVPDVGRWPPLRAVVRHPILGPDGTWTGARGYHDGLLLDVDGEWPEPGMTRADAEAALATLRTHVRYYPWATPADESVAMSMLVTAVMRPMLEAAPMHALDAPAAGSGKSLLADVAAILATGARAAVMDYGRDPDEAAKRLDGMLLAGDAVIAVDNIETPLEGATLCQTLTQPSRRIRPLGASTMVTVPCTALLLATGNNLTIRGDLVRRALVCRIDAGVERPELREIPQDIVAETIERRAELVAAAQTIARAYVLAGCPPVDVPPLGSYREWTRLVRAPLVWLGMPDPAGVIERARADDPSREAVAAVLGAWRAAYGDEAATAQEAIARAEHDRELHDALAMVAMRRGQLDARALGYWLRANRDARSGSLVLRRHGVKGPYRWRVQGAHGAHGAHVCPPRGRAPARAYDHDRGRTSAPSAPSAPRADAEVPF